MAPLRITLWNVNGVSRHKLEMAQFLQDKHIDVMLLSKTHLTNKYKFKINGYIFYGTNHPDGKAHGGTGVLIRNRIKHTFRNDFATNYLQATSLNIQLGNGQITLAAVYRPPRFTISENQFFDFFNTLGDRFIAAGDYNAKHTHWGSRLVTPKGKQLYNTIIKISNKLSCASPGTPTYWPTDPRKIPDLIDFAVTRNISHNHINAESLPDLSSDRSPVLLNYLQCPDLKNSTCRLTSNRTNWLKYKKFVSSHIELNPRIINKADTESTAKLFESVLVAAACLNPRKTNCTVYAT